jgi:transcriptional regulator with XRE-family HTH domain
MSDHGTIGRRIKEERESAGYTQAQLAQAIGIDATVLSRIESGQRGIDSLILRRAARALDVPMERFFDVSQPLALARGADGEHLAVMINWARKMKADLRFVREATSRYG